MTATRILFVCTGNICRSPFAELLATHLVRDLPAGHPAHDGQFASAGISGLENWPMDAGMGAELEARGGSPAGFTARQLTAAMAREADLVLTLEPVHRAWILEEWPSLVRRTWLLGQAARVAPALVDDGGAGGGVDLTAALRDHRDLPQPSDAIADPYRRGPAAAARAAAEIEAAVRALLGL